jgi:hypothetical protein
MNQNPYEPPEYFEEPLFPKPAQPQTLAISR